jgi:hypothetical protein
MQDSSKLGWSVVYRDGEVLTNLSYPEAMMYFNEAFQTNNPCSVRMPGNNLTQQFLQG